MRRACKHLVLVALVSLFVGLGTTASYQESSPAQAAPQPNIIFILADDMRKDDLNNTYMPQTTTELVGKGMSFQNAFVSNPFVAPLEPPSCAVSMPTTPIYGSTTTSSTQTPTSATVADTTGTAMKMTSPRGCTTPVTRLDSSASTKRLRCHHRAHHPAPEVGRLVRL